MSGQDGAANQRLNNLLFRAHPWHGVSIGDEAPEVVTAYIEIVPTDTVKYEVDKVTGFLKVDRPQRFSNLCPSYYGLVPQTYCGERVAELFAKRASRKGIVGDRDPLDICVLTEKTIPHSDILLTALPIGGLSMLDGGEADDKIIAVMKDDAVYKQAPGTTQHKVEITNVYGRAEALKVIRASHADYRAQFPELASRCPKSLS